MAAMPRPGWLALGAVVAALLIEQQPGVAALLAGGMVALLCGAVGRVSHRPWLLWLSAGGGLVLLRAVAGGVPAPVDAAQGPVLTGGDGRTALVVSVGTPGGGLQRAVLELLPPEPPERVYAWLPRYPPVIPGDQVAFDGRLEPAPDEPGFGEFLARSGIGHTVRSRKLERLDGSDSPVAALEQMRRAAGELLARSLPEPQAGLGAAIIVGLRDLVARDVAEDFRIAGLSHVVAISGWHVAMVAGVLSALLSGLSRRRRSVALVVAIAAYAVVAGGAPSVVRAALMAGVVLLARESGRRGQASAALGLAVLAMLLVEPATVAEVGFQLSVAATAGLLCWASPLSDRLRRRAPSAVPGWLIATLAVSLAAQAATLPLVLLHFGRLSLVAPVSNLLLAPVVGPAMLGAAIALLCGGLAALGLPAVLLAPFTLAGALGLGLMVGIADAAASLPFASIDLQPPWDMATAGTGGLALLWALRRRRLPPLTATGLPELSLRAAANEPPRTGRLRLALGASGMVLVLLVVLVTTARPDGRLRMTVLDVGQGDSILLTGPSGGRMLIDTGPDPDRLVALLDQRLPAWDRRLDLVAVTHPHEDHVAGLALLLDRYRVGGVVEPGMVGPGPGDAAFRRRLAELGRATRIVAAGDRLLLDGIEISIHWPLPGRVPLRATGSGKEINNVSLVFDLRFGQRRLLLTGDVEEEIDPQLVARGLAGRASNRLDVLKVAHHGSGSATTDAFVEHLQPRIAVVSAGSGNPYGHPSRKTVERLEQAGAKLYRTDLDGTVEISTDGSDLLASAGGGRPLPNRPTSQVPPGVGFCPLPQQTGSRRRPYNRADVRAQPTTGRSAAARARTRALVGGTLGGRGGGRRLPGRALRATRRRPRPFSGRGGGAPP
jgi:competence protein ComEC